VGPHQSSGGGASDAVRGAEWWAVPGVANVSVDLPGEVQQLAERFAAGADVASLGSQLVGLRELIDQLEAVWLTAAADFDAGGGPAEDGAGSLAAWMRHRCRIAPGEAAARVRVVDALAGALGEPMVATAVAMRDGEVSWRHADVVARTLRDVPADRRAEAERALVPPAKSLDPLLLKRVGTELLHRLDADRADRAAVRRMERRGLDLAETYEGMVAVSGLLDPVSGATVLAAVEALVAPTRGDEGDERSGAQRRADALTEVCRTFLDSGRAPEAGGVRPHVSVVVDLSVLRREPGCGAGHLSWVGPVTAEQARMLACDATVSRVVTDGASQVLDVGRATRSIPTAIRRAVVVRDRTCVAPGCHAPPQRCDVHHVVFWEDGGGTSLDNLVMLCRRHHGFVHLRGWSVREGADGTRTLAPPQGRHPPPPHRRW
jgi:Domain of unknown function (DUF222)/HNH endonuclease